MSEYKRTIKLSELNDSILPNLKDFIEYLSDLSILYGDDVAIPVAEVPSLSDNYLFLGGGGIKGTFQDEAILQHSAEQRLNKLVLLTKLGVIRGTNIDKNIPLERREVVIHLVPGEITKLLSEIVPHIEAVQKKKDEQIREKSEIIYKNGRVVLDKKSFAVVGLEEALCKIVFDGSDQKKFDLSKVIEEFTGDLYVKSSADKYLQPMRQATIRVNKKIYDTFDKKDALKYSTRTREIIKTC